MRNFGLILAIIIAAAPAAAQTGTVQGRVQTTGGDPIPNARVDMVHLDSLPAPLAEFLRTLPPKIPVTPVVLQEGGRIENAARASGPAGPRIGASTTTDATGRFVFKDV
jgi:hypothetical protein